MTVRHCWVIQLPSANHASAENPGKSSATAWEFLSLCAHWTKTQKKWPFVFGFSKERWNTDVRSEEGNVQHNNDRYAEQFWVVCIFNGRFLRELSCVIQIRLFWYPQNLNRTQTTFLCLHNAKRPAILEKCKTWRNRLEKTGCSFLIFFSFSADNFLACLGIP